MATTNIPIGDPRAVKRWSNSLAMQTQPKAYWNKFESTSDEAIVQRKTELEEDAGDDIQFDLNMDLRGTGVTGDNRLEGTEENLQFYSDRVKLDQYRKAVSSGGRMSRKRTLHNLRTIARNRLSDFLAKWMDDAKFAYASGDVGLTAVNLDRRFNEPNFAGNAITAPDADHIMYGGTATSKATITTADIMSVTLLERASVKPGMMQAVNPDAIRMMPVMVGGDTKGKFIVLMSTWQGYQLRTSTDPLAWTRIQQAMATYEGRDNPMIKGGLGMIAGLVLHEHESVLRWNNAGAGSNLPMARALLLGRQALVCAYGTGNKGSRMMYEEESADYGNLVNQAGGFITGLKKTTFNGLDFGVTAIDTYCINPNP